MPKPDEGHRLTDEQLAELERRIAGLYKEAADEVQDEIDAYFERFRHRDGEMKALIGTVQNGREWTEQDYKQWRLSQIARGEQYRALRDKLARRYTNANEVAIAYVNDATPGIYALNRNFGAYTMEAAGANVDFTLWDEQTVKRLAVERPDLMPYYPPKRALKRGIDLAYGKRQITASVTSSILQGKSIKGVADDLQRRLPEMNRSSAIRTARTAVTGAQNAGRMDSYAAAEKMGIRLKKKWIATLDNRTRHAHAMLDGQTVDTDKPFQVDGYEIRYPGDKSAPGYLVYNCRCTVSAVLADQNIAAGARRARNADTGQNETIPGMTYSEWEKQKQAENKTVWDTYVKKGKNLSADRTQWQEYRKVLGKNVPGTLDSFQNLKYNEPEKWSDVKAHYRYKNRVPEATREDFEKYKEVKATGVTGTVRVPPEAINIDELAFNDAHGKHHGCTLDDAKGYVQTAKCTVRRKRWDGVSINYYSLDGAAYVDAENLKIKTAFSEKDFDPMTNSIMEVFK